MTKSNSKSSSVCPTSLINRHLAYWRILDMDSDNQKLRSSLWVIRIDSLDGSIVPKSKYTFGFRFCQSRNPTEFRKMLTLLANQQDWLQNFHSIWVMSPLRPPCQDMRLIWETPKPKSNNHPNQVDPVTKRSNEKTVYLFLCLEPSHTCKPEL